jgi:hypothetical protein
MKINKHHANSVWGTNCLTSGQQGGLKRIIIFTCGNTATTEASRIAFRQNLSALRAQREGPLISLSKEQI